jgi:cystathionine beta-lyase
MTSPAINPLEQLTLTELRNRTSMKWRTQPNNVLPLWVAEMDVMLAEPISRALNDAVSRGDTGYPGDSAYAEALQSFAADRWGWDTLAVERTAIVPDVMMGVVEMLRLVTVPGSSVVISCPVYPPFYSFVLNMDRHIVEAPLAQANRIDFDNLAEAFAKAAAGGKLAAYLLCSPHNPTGTVHTAEELQTVAALAAEYNIRVIADEIHAPLAMPGERFIPYLSVPGAAENGLSPMSASKGWNPAELKAALAIAGREAAADLARMPEEVSHGPSHLGIIAQAAAFREGGQWLDTLLAGLDSNRHLLQTLLREHIPGIGCSLAQATYLAWLDCSGPGRGHGRSREISEGLDFVMSHDAELLQRLEDA